jgi:hypothetical protein
MPWWQGWVAKAHIMSPQQWFLPQRAQNTAPRRQGSVLAGRFHFEDRDDCISLDVATPKSDEEVWVAIANFKILRVLQQMSFSAGLDAAHGDTLLLVRHRINASGSGIVYLAHTDIDRSPSYGDVMYLDVEVLVQPSKIKGSADLFGMFNSGHVSLMTMTMEPKHFFDLLGSLPKPEPQRIISNWYRQPDGTIVFANCCVKDGDLLSHEDANWRIIGKYFTDAICPILPENYPRIVLIPYPHVRYFIAVNMYTNLMPKFFGNNLMQARAVLSYVVMSMHCDKVWDRQAGIGKLPTLMCHSDGPNTGKTEACHLANALQGRAGGALKAGDITKPALKEELCQNNSACAVMVDDI